MAVLSLFITLGLRADGSQRLAAFRCNCRGVRRNEECGGAEIGVRTGLLLAAEKGQEMPTRRFSTTNGRM